MRAVTGARPRTAAHGEVTSDLAPGQTRQTAPCDGLDAEELIASLPSLPFWTGSRADLNGSRLRGARRILGWLAAHPGDGWQQRWLASGADDGPGWISTVAAGGGDLRPVGRHVVTDGLHCLLLRRVVLPSYEFLHGYQTNALFRHAKDMFSPELFDRVRQAGRAAGHSAYQQSSAEGCLVKILLHIGHQLDDFTPADLLDYRAWALARRGSAPAGLHTAWGLLRDVGVLPADLPLHRAVGQGQLPNTQLIDRYGIRCAPVRDVLVRYLDERRPSLDYASLQHLAGHLAGLFWADLERHHPGIDSLHLPADVAEAWKQRVAVITRNGKPVPRRNRLGVLLSVRAFYLDIAQWALEDPSWVPWAVPSPIRQADLGGFAKEKKTVQARMHQRVRERLPRLPDLVDAAERHRAEQGSLLAAAQTADVGQCFEHAGTRYRRIGHDEDRARQRPRYRTSMILVEDAASGVQRDVTRDEDDAFWAWVVIETLRHTGCRIEEMLEITHLALVSYQLPDTGETVPLLQIVPSKSNEERLLLVSPELASVLATVITRLRNDNAGTVPMIARYDPAEHVTGPPLPHLFQRHVRQRRDVLSNKTVYRLINDTAARAGLTDPTGQPLRFTAHDFRRMFTTEAVSNGLPVHIAARLLGHASITTTEAYLAVFQDDLVRSYRAFLDARRAVRPAEEYREPTDDEWREFQQHFYERKLELGDCGRPYGTGCQHEHACIRCPMLRVSPRQRPRLVGIIRNLTDRIAEARANGWLGEIQGLQASLTKAQEKLASLDRTRGGDRVTTNLTDLGMPTIPDPSPPTRC
ncbi:MULTISPECIES: site-specific integrase [unclassified Frankia]|uniref:site-specific integrase n=1 Tax=unclassified Frankia TaxID=2632575 RepID=UPI001EF7457F|nr:MULTISPECIES: site-specific integrase [unclassified Frankia]